ncbi:MAG TPA: SDR family oxidoreductase [Nitrospira sp.]|nr:SDR family oxidoreductase [Nitrospira sp.]
MNQAFSIEGKNLLVTGGTRGIGRAVSLQFARAGARVIANYVRGQQSADNLLAQAQQEQLHLTLCRADLTIPKGLDSVEEVVTGLTGGLHGLVYCAATGVHKSFDELTLRHYDWTFALNVRAFFDLVKRLLPRFASDASIVAVSSQGALRVVPAYSVVGASKGALEALARHLAVELAPRGIRVNIVCPGAVATEAWTSIPQVQERLAELTKRTPIGRLVAPEDVAQAAQFLCSDAARTIIGHTLVIDGGAGLPV